MISLDPDDEKRIMRGDRIDRALGQLMTEIEDTDYADGADRDSDLEALREVVRIAHRLFWREEDLQS